MDSGDEIVYIQHPLEISTPKDMHEINEPTEEGWNHDINTELDMMKRSTNVFQSGQLKRMNKANMRKILSSSIDATLMSQDLNQLQRMECPVNTQNSVELKKKALSAIYRPLILMKDESRSNDYSNIFKQQSQQ